MAPMSTPPNPWSQGLPVCPLQRRDVMSLRVNTEDHMFRSIINAIRGAFKNVFAMLWELFWVPFGLVAGAFGGGAGDPPVGDGPRARALSEELAAEKGLADSHVKVA